MREDEELPLMENKVLLIFISHPHGRKSLANKECLPHLMQFVQEISIEKKHLLGFALEIDLEYVKQKQMM